MGATMRLALVFCVLLLVGLSLLPTTSASPGTGALDFGAAPLLEGTLAGTGPGEVQFGADATLVGAATQLKVVRVWHEETHVRNPVGSPVVTDAGEVQRSEETLESASFRLAAVGPLFDGLAYTVGEGRIDLAPAQVAGLELAAFDRPTLVVDAAYVEGQSRADDRVFTYQAAGPRFPLAAAASDLVGAFALYAWDAAFEVTDASGTRTYASGVRTVEESPTMSRVIHEYHLLEVTAGRAALTSAEGVAWLADPVLDFQGSLTANPATGDVRVGGELHHLEGDPVLIEGSLQLTPRPRGEPVTPDDGDSMHVGTNTPTGGAYPGTHAPFAGDVTHLAFGGYIPAVQEGDLALVATVGVFTLAGAVFLATPHGKWLLGALIAPLYAKTSRDRLLANESRDRIFQAIRSNPGINLSQIHRLADLGWGVTVYHLKMMEKNGLIFSERSARDKCFFENHPRYRVLRSAIAALANKEPVQRVASAVTSDPDLTQSDVIAATGLSQRAVSYYLNRLGSLGLVETRREGNYMRYRPKAALSEALDLVTELPSDDEPFAEGAAVSHAPPVNA